MNFPSRTATGEIYIGINPDTVGDIEWLPVPDGYTHALCTFIHANRVDGKVCGVLFDGVRVIFDSSTYPEDLCEQLDEVLRFQSGEDDEF